MEKNSFKKFVLKIVHFFYSSDIIKIEDFNFDGILLD